MRISGSQDAAGIERARDPRGGADGTVPTAFEWVKAVWRAFGSGSGFVQVTFVNRSEYKPPSVSFKIFVSESGARRVELART